MKKLSIVGSDIQKDEHVVGYYNTGDRMKYWGKLGAFWGWTSGLLFDSAFFLIPGIGPLIVAGPLVGGLIGALEGAVAVGGLSAIGAGLYSLGIPKDSILKYETALKTDKFVLIAHGSIDEINRAKEILHRIHSEALEQHQSNWKVNIYIAEQRSNFDRVSFGLIMRSRLFQVASALLSPLGKIGIDAFVEIPKSARLPASRHSNKQRPFLQ